MKILSIFTACALVALLPLSYGKPSSMIDSPISNTSRLIKVYTYWDACQCYMLTFDDGANDGCIWWITGEDASNNGRCD